MVFQGINDYNIIAFSSLLVAGIPFTITWIQSHRLGMDNNAYSYTFQFTTNKKYKLSNSLLAAMGCVHGWIPVC